MMDSDSTPEISTCVCVASGCGLCVCTFYVCVRVRGDVCVCGCVCACGWVGGWVWCGVCVVYNYSVVVCCFVPKCHSLSLEIFTIPFILLLTHPLMQSASHTLRSSRS